MISEHELTPKEEFEQHLRDLDDEEEYLREIEYKYDI